MKILIVRLSAIGDVVQGIPCLVALKESFPDWKISWLVEETSEPILKNHPLLHRLHVLHRGWRKGRDASLFSRWSEGLGDIRRVKKEIQSEGYDAAIDLQGLFKSGWWTWLSGAPRRIGHGGTREGAAWFLNEIVSSRPTFDPSYPLVQRYLEPAKHLGANISTPKYVLPPSTPETIAATNLLLKGQTGFTAICPWSAWPSKNWPLERWRGVIQKLAPSQPIIVLGSKSEENEATRLVENIPGVLNLAGRTGLDLLPEIFRRCHLVMGPDTGLLHLANATGIPKILMLFGSTSWKRSGPLGAGHQTLSTELPCQPCFERICPLGHLSCQKDLAVDQVLRAALSLVAH